MLIKGETGDWEIVIGLEVHAQVISNSKLFSGAATNFGAEPNEQVSFVDAGMPGMLPVINEKCVEQAVRTGLGLKAEINLTSVFDRKNYFYADLPAGYQISQYLQPIVGKGTIVLDMPDGKSRSVGITRLHLEQDAGKSLHDQHPTLSYIDLNRAGIALMEIVSEPDLRSPEEAGAYLRKLRSILRYLGTCDGNMDEGSMRCDANVSVRKLNGPLGTRCEIKNVNSVKFLMQAIEFEARRQVEIIEGGGKIVQETRLYDSGKGETRSMRSKEHAHDYRYFPDPDLLPLTLDAAWVEGIKRTLPELPDDKKDRFIRDYKLTPYQASVLVAEKADADAYEQKLLALIEKKASPESVSAFKHYADMARIAQKPELPGQLVITVTTSANSMANWFLGDLAAAANTIGKPLSIVSGSTDVEGLIALVDNSVLSGRMAKDVLIEIVGNNKSAAAVVEEKGLRQVSDTGAIAAEIDKVLAANADKVAEFKGGKDKLFGFFVGQVMKATGGKANPGLVNDLLKKKLSS